MPKINLGLTIVLAYVIAYAASIKNFAYFDLNVFLMFSLPLLWPIIYMVIRAKLREIGILKICVNFMWGLFWGRETYLSFIAFISIGNFHGSSPEIMASFETIFIIFLSVSIVSFVLFLINLYNLIHGIQHALQKQ